MAYDQQERDAVRASYIFKHLDLKDCSRVHQIPYNTVRAWKKAAKEKGDDWDTARNAARMANGGMTEVTNMMLEAFALHSDSILEEIRNSVDMAPGVKVDIMTKLSDGYTKLVSSAAKSGTKVAPLALAMNVLKMQTEFIKEYFPQHANAFMEIIEPFGRKVAEDLG